MKFFIPCIPPKATSQGSGKRIMQTKNGPVFFKNKKAKEAELSLTDLLMPHQPETPFEGPLELRVVFQWPWLKSMPKRVTENHPSVWYDKRPDCSNIVKMIEDMMTRLRFWTDDSQVSRLIVEKQLGDNPGISIEINSLEWIQ